MKRITKILLCVLCAVAAVLCVAAACFMLLKKQSGTTASSAASGASVSVYGKVSDFDYSSFDYSEGLDDNGHWTGIRALDYVTFELDFPVNACVFTVEDGVLVATEKDGTRHEVLTVPEKDAVDVVHMKEALENKDTDALTPEEIACMPGAEA